jgi:quinol monooxygenase YgiN
VIDRRTLIATGAVLTMAGPIHAREEKAMYGLIGRIKAASGRRAELAAILLEGTGEMPGCLSYVVAEDVADPDALWVTEVWDSKDSHAASLQLPIVQAAIAKAKPIIAGFDSRAEMVPLGGVGLPRR